MNNALIIRGTDYDTLVRKTYDIVDYEEVKSVEIGRTADEDTFVVFLPDDLPASLVIIYFANFGISFKTENFTPCGWLRLDGSVQHLHSLNMVMMTMTDVMIDDEQEVEYAIVTSDGNCYIEDDDNCVDDENYSFTICFKPNPNKGISYKEFSIPKIISKEHLEITEGKHSLKFDTHIGNFLLRPFSAIVYTPINLFSFVKPTLLRVILVMAGVVGVLLLPVSGWWMLEDTLFPVYVRVYHVFAVAAVLGLFAAFYVREKNSSFTDYLNNVIECTISYAAYFYILVWIILAPNKYFPVAEQKIMDATIVESCRKKSRSDYYYQIVFKFNQYPYQLSRNIGDDDTFHKGQKCKILYHTGLYGLDVIDDVTH